MQFVRHNSDNQVLLWNHLDLFLSQMGANLGVSTTLRLIIEDNLSLCSQVRSETDDSGSEGPP